MKRITLLSAAVAIAAIVTSLQVHAQGGGRNGIAARLFDALDADHDGSLTRSEVESGFNSWFTSWNTAKNGALTQDEIADGLSTLLPAPPPARPGQGNTFNVEGNSTPMIAPQSQIDAMMAALPKTPGAKPLRVRKVLVFAHTGPGGFVHASIPLAAKTVEALGNQGNLWSTTVSYNPADITAKNLKQYDAIFLDSTTGCFLDDPDLAVTKARRAAFMDFVHSGRGVAGIHAASDSYHTDCVAAEAAAKSGRARNGFATMLAGQLLEESDENHNGTVNQQEFKTFADDWFDKLDADKSGKISRSEFAEHFNTLMAAPRRGGEPKAVLQWPEFNKLIGGYFKFHWPDPQLIYVKIDDPNSPLTAMFHGKEFEIHDETYTFAQDSFSRKNVHVLTSIDYDKMSPEDKAKEVSPRTDHDYGLSWIHRVGRGRVFYEAHGHDARVYAMTPMLEHIRAGIQYALGDLKADDSPSEK
ncbi:MAG TPA: ThuA domain-containing protein [Bryobacteraceae bacterium]|jgi:type 1 glutamine amidotransferase|nr:ThuA domain-containing protein [Bryobacteraceae bacterium]